MNKTFLTALAISSSIIFSACSTNGGELFQQAINSTSPGADKPIVISDAPVKVIEIDEVGFVMTDKKAKPLYVKSDDFNGVSSCYDECEIAWPPLLINDPADVSGDYSTTERTDGELQITYLGQPLYRYTPDSARKVTGDGFRGVWSVVTVDIEETE